MMNVTKYKAVREETGCFEWRCSQDGGKATNFIGDQKLIPEVISSITLSILRWPNLRLQAVVGGCELYTLNKAEINYGQKCNTLCNISYQYFGALFQRFLFL